MPVIDISPVHQFQIGDIYLTINSSGWVDLSSDKHKTLNGRHHWNAYGDNIYAFLAMQDADYVLQKLIQYRNRIIDHAASRKALIDEVKKRDLPGADQEFTLDWLWEDCYDLSVQGHQVPNMPDASDFFVYKDNPSVAVFNEAWAEFRAFAARCGIKPSPFGLDQRGATIKNQTFNFT